MIVGNRIDSLKKRVTGADGIAALLRVLEELHRLEPEHENGEELDDLRLDAFDALARLTRATPHEAVPIIVRYLVPLCLRSRGEWRVPHVARRYDEALSRWLDRFPSIHRYALRAGVLEAVERAIGGAATARAVRLIGMLGYRDERLCKRLLDLARSGDDAICDVALHVLAVLGVPPSQHPDLVELWGQRARAAWNHDLIGAAKHLGSPEVLGPVFDCWLIPENLRTADAGRSFLPQLAMNVPAAVADRFSQDAELQFSVWDRLQRLKPTAGGLFFQRVLGSTQVAHLCDTPGVVRHYLSALAGDTRTRDLAYLRLEECDRPRQLLGWANDPDGEVTQAVLHDALAPTGMVGSFVTQDLRRKLHALHTLLCLARAEALAVVEAAVAGEQNGHVVASVLDIAACFRLASVPHRVCDLIAGEFGGIADDSERLSSHVSAIAVARACEPRSAFETLLHFNLIREGGVLISLLDALTETAAALIQAGDAGAADRLWQTVARGEPEHRRAAAAAALGRLVRRNLLRPLPAGRLVEMLEDQTLDRYARRAVLEGLGHLSPEQLTPQLVQLLWRAVETAPPTAGDNPQTRGADFRPVALASLARLGLLETNPDALREHLGLRLEGNTWRYDRPPLFPGASLVVGILYTREPAAYAAAAADLLRVGDWTAVVQLVSFLRTGPRPAPESIANAILDRMRGAAPETGEPDLVLLLAELAPVRIASQSWAAMFSWPPQVRAALAQALTLSEPSDEVDRRVNILLVLMGDGQYGVRREAFRALARISPEGIRSFCTAWAIMTEANLQPSEEPYGIDMRRTAAEAAAWLDSPPTEGPIADLAWDPEPEVRATFERCRRERRERDWAEHYLRHVLDVQDDASLLKAWKYGRALERLGDDYVLERLEERRRQDLPPSVRNWLGRLITKVRSRWDEVTRGWPEPWVARRGGLERVDGTIGEDPTPKSIWLWLAPAKDLVEFGVWGGWSSGYLPLDMQMLHVPGRRPTTVLVTKTTLGTGGAGPTYFVGSGPYPEAPTTVEPSD